MSEVVKDLAHWSRPKTVHMDYQDIDYLVELQSRQAFADSRYAAAAKASWCGWLPIDNFNNKISGPAIFFLKDIVESENITWINKSHLGAAHLDDQYFGNNNRIISRLQDDGSFDDFYLFSSSETTKYVSTHDGTQKKMAIEKGSVSKIQPLANDINIKIPDLKFEYPSRKAKKNPVPVSKRSYQSGDYDTLKPLGILFDHEFRFVLFEDYDKELRGWGIWEQEIKALFNHSFQCERTNSKTPSPRVIENDGGYHANAFTHSKASLQITERRLESLVDFMGKGQLSKEALEL